MLERDAAWMPYGHQIASQIRGMIERNHRARPVRRRYGSARCRHPRTATASPARRRIAARWAACRQIEMVQRSCSVSLRAARRFLALASPSNRMWPAGYCPTILTASSRKIFQGPVSLGLRRNTERVQAYQIDQCRLDHRRASHWPARPAPPARQRKAKALVHDRDSCRFPPGEIVHRPRASRTPGAPAPASRISEEASQFGAIECNHMIGCPQHSTEEERGAAPGRQISGAKSAP